ncbi:hypothetical protein [Halorubrum distributum]|uniref:hypothetical protein n=1 Tax=Halorubrum distributum TaxID=29283 RepID=UPI001F4C56BB|nr:hypothetical protein [Halorubrum distributum]
MERRKFVVGLGALASGSAAAVGTGAFTSVTADRSVDVEVAGDSSAYLALTRAAGDSAGNTSPNSNKYVQKSSGEVSFDFDGANTDGDGFNPNSVTVIEDLIEVQNQGTQSAYLGVDLSDLTISDGSGNEAGIELAASIPDDGSTTGQTGSADDELAANIAFQGSGNAVGNATSPSSYELDVGEAVHLDLTVDTTNFDNSDVSTTGTVAFIADQTSSL